MSGIGVAGPPLLAVHAFLSVGKRFACIWGWACFWFLGGICFFLLPLSSFVVGSLILFSLYLLYVYYLFRM